MHSLFSFNRPFTLLLFFSCFVRMPAQAQEYKHKFPAGPGKMISFSSFSNKVSLEGYEGDEVIIQAKGYEGPPKRADGLKSLSATGTDNSGIGLSVTEEGNTLLITKVTHGRGEYTIRVPRNARVVYEENDWTTNEEIKISGMTGEVEISSKNNSITCSNMTGPLVLNSVSGNILVSYSGLKQGAPSSFSTVSGFIDLTLPKNAGANLKMGTVSGEIYSNFDIKPEKEGRLIKNGNQVTGSINAGGTPLVVKSISGNIYLRAAK